MPEPRAAAPALLLGLALLASGCGFDAKYRRKDLRAPSLSVKLEYRTMPGDRIAVTFLRGLGDTASGTYRLQSGDELRLSVQDRPDLDGVSAVAPDGSLYLPFLEPVAARGRTLGELRKEVEERYQPVVKSARVSLVPVRFGGQVESLLAGLASPGRPGATYEAPVGADGAAPFPHLGFLAVEGRTSREVGELVRDRYRAVLPGAVVTASLVRGSSRLLTVLGEMRRPGAFPVEGHVSLATALGLAEGWLPGAKLGDIVLVQARVDDVVISKYDLGKDLLAATRLQLQGGDLVFVPRTAITDLNVFVDQYLRRNLPVPLGLTVPFPGL